MRLKQKQKRANQEGAGEAKACDEGGRGQLGVLDTNQNKQRACLPLDWGTAPGVVVVVAFRIVVFVR